MSSTGAETREFQAEVRQLLDIVINSLYTERKIFLRELISNAADAIEKCRYINLTGRPVADDGLPWEIAITTDNIAHTITIKDTGTGMTKEELVENLGTIAHSGSREFVRHLAEGASRDVNLIGQFGVGFYSAFMVAEKVTLYTRSHLPEAQGWIWSSAGSGSYVIEEALDLQRGTKIVLHLKKEFHDFARAENVKEMIQRYSSFVPYPIFVNGERVNTIQAVWTKNKSEVSGQEYNEFYKYIANTSEEPLYRLHFSSDAPLTINALLFIPEDHLERFGFSRLEPGVNLYCKKVLIQAKSDSILPVWLRFIKGVVDSEELPLNISRETMQDSALISRLRRVITGRLLKFLDEQAGADPSKYKEFWEKYGPFIKEGLATDLTYREDIVKLLRFKSSRLAEGEVTSLKEYVGRMGKDQQFIYFINGPTREMIEAGPYLEAFKDRDIEVLYTYEAIDDFILNLLGAYEGKRIVSADQADLELPGNGQQETAGEGLPAGEMGVLTAWLKEVLGEGVTEVRASSRLVESPAMVLSSEGTYSMQRLRQLMTKEKDAVGPQVLEINGRHSLIKQLNSLRQKNDPFAQVAAQQILENAQICAGLVPDPRVMVDRMYQILERAMN